MPRSRSNKHFAAARRALFALVLLMAGIAGWQWLQSHPEHNPWAPLDLRDPPGWATQTKLIALRSDVKPGSVCPGAKMPTLPCWPSVATAVASCTPFRTLTC